MQDEFLKNLCESGETVFCFLVNGIKLEGVITAYDQFTLIMASERDGAASQMIMKSAVSTVVPKSNSSFNG